MAFQALRPGVALINDIVFAGVQAAVIVLLFVIGWSSAPWMITAWGVGGTVGAVLGWRRSPALAKPARGLHLVKRLWPMGRWMLADFLTGFASDQAYLVFIALLLTGADHGGFRAATSLMGPPSSSCWPAATSGCGRAVLAAGHPGAHLRG